MKYLKSITFAVLLIFGLSGCYTQLQYSQKVKRITDREPAGEYAWDGEEQAYANEGDYEGTANDEYYEDYVPAYKDYETSEFYNDCNCDIYDYQQGYFDGVEDALTAVRYDYFQPYYSSYFRYNLGFYPYHSSFGFGYYYGYAPINRYFYHRFYSPYYYSPFYYHSFYHHGYGPFFSYNYYYFDNDYRYYNRDNHRYGPRSIGSSRLRGDSGTRTRSGASGSDIRTRTRSDSQGDIRTRSNTNTRSRGTIDRTRSRSGSSGSVGSSRTRSSNGSGTVSRTRSGNGSDGSRSRSGNVNRSRDNNDEYISRVGILQNRYSRSVRDIRADRQRRNLLQQARERYHQQNQQKSSGIWGRLKSAFGADKIRSLRNDRNSRSGNTIRSRSAGSNSRSVHRSRSNSRSSSGSSVGRSRSKSSSGSGSRSRSGGNSRSRSGGNI